MALATKCPHCGTVFKVAADQLKLRGGIVRCGKCSEVFDGNGALVDPEAALQRLAPAPESAEPAPEPAAEETPVYTLDFDTTFEPLGIIPKPGDAGEEQAKVVPEDTGPPPQLDIDFDLDLAPLPAKAAPVQADLEPEPEIEDQAGPEPAPEPGFEPEPEPETEPEPEPLGEEAHSAELVPSPVAAETVHAEEPAHVPEEAEEPGFVTRVRKKEKATRVTRILMAVGSVMLLAGLLAQGINTFASVLAARYPQAKPALTEACKLLRCQVTLPAQIDTLSVETGELQTIASNTFLFATVLRNDSTLVQAWPHIELALTDTADKALVRRVITPAEYLPPRTDMRRGFAAKTEQPVKVYFQLTGVNAAGYHIAIFYP